MPRLCFGGSFNPIHHAHLICARAVAEAAGYEKVVLIPAKTPPHKSDLRQIAPAAHRAAMCRIATADTPLFDVDEIELEREGPSYTIVTARALRERGWGDVNWLIGADMVRLLPEWHEAEALLHEVNFTIMARPGWSFDWQTMPPAFRFLRDRVISAPLIDISATQVRDRVAAGKPIDFLTPRLVVDYINRNNLYR